MNKGIWYAIGAYACWGLLPVYWKLLHHVPSVQLLGHRIIWSFAALLVIVLLLRRWKEFCTAVITPNVLKIYLLAAVLIGINWLTYVWAVNHNHMVETSLGYFINPLLSVLMGVFFFHERLRSWQWLPVGLALAGVLFLTVVFGAVPWIALTLACSFALYAAVKKIAPLHSLHGLLLETSILFLPASAYLAYSNAAGSGVFLHAGAATDWLLIGAGLTTTIPLFMFSSAAQRIPLSLIGILQYISPSLQFLLGVFIYSEPFSPMQFIGYSLVWAALIIFACEGFSSSRAQSIGSAEIE